MRISHTKAAAALFAALIVSAPAWGRTHKSCHEDFESCMIEATASSAKNCERKLAESKTTHAWSDAKRGSYTCLPDEG